MPLATQMRVMRTLAELLLAEEAKPFPAPSTPKPVFIEAKKSVALPRCAPEETGIASHALEGFYRRMAALADGNLHSLLMAKDGKIVSEGYFAPYRPEVWHVTHSLAKSFTGTAVGLAVEEGLFGLDDRVADFFPDKVNRLTPRRTKAITVRHLLTMSSGISYNEISQTVDEDWLHGIFASAPSFEPGSKFLYNSMNSYLLSALLQRTSGASMLDYLAPRLLEPMGFGPVASEKCPSGMDKGGWGMYITVEDMAKFGQLYLNDGLWDTREGQQRLLPKWWVREATHTQIRSEEGERYGYHIWVDNNRGDFMMNGMFGQNITVMPRLGMLVAMTGGSPYATTAASAQDEVRRTFATWETPAGPLPADPVSLASLHSALVGLRYGQPLPDGERRPARVPARTRRERWNNLRLEAPALTNTRLAAFCNTTWRFEKNRAGLLPTVLQVMDNNLSPGVQALHLQPHGGGLLMLWEENGTTACLPVGIGKAEEQMVTAGGERFLLASECTLRQDEDGNDVLLLRICPLEHSSIRLIKLRLQGNNKLLVQMDENPNLEVAIDTVFQQQAKTGGPGGKSEGPFAQLLANEYVDHKIHRLCTPQLVGKPIE